jgi:hypothetical protein
MEAPSGGSSKPGLPRRSHGEGGSFGSGFFTYANVVPFFENKNHLSHIPHLVETVEVLEVVRIAAILRQDLSTRLVDELKSCRSGREKPLPQ